jgi:hypothetical protein
MDVLEELRRDDDRWRLRLIGTGFAPEANLTQAAISYRDALERRIEDLGDAVVRPGYTKDVPHSLRRIGVILSSSLREGTHEALIQGAASGALPVARNWPFVARWGGAHTMFPDEWVVETPAEAANRIRRAIEAGPLFEQTEATAQWAFDHYDWSVVGPQLKALLLRPDE